MVLAGHRLTGAVPSSSLLCRVLEGGMCLASPPTTMPERAARDGRTAGEEQRHCAARSLQAPPSLRAPPHRACAARAPRTAQAELLLREKPGKITSLRLRTIHKRSSHDTLPSIRRGSSGSSARMRKLKGCNPLKAVASACAPAAMAFHGEGETREVRYIMT
ncbi:26S proteasome complex subunit DSS1 [Platysternon megacephalum]|uniref:26S proteasome complex subunit DSS1 n=1 Tax=Platysternon megacephalum TaxID=55544 RepID=A0A4D9EMI2_9SAUR|nr:26S proteasome complex subunit DSS1 [Platysternon megacephalum]